MKVKVNLLLCLAMTLVLGTARSQSNTNPPIPDFEFSEKISSDHFTVSADTRTSDPSNGKVVGTVNLDFQVSSLGSIGFAAIGTWSQATKEWTFILDTTVNTPLDKYGFKNGTLIKTNKGWQLSGDLNMATLKYLSDNQSNSSEAISQAAHFIWLEGTVDILLKEKSMSISYGPASLLIKDTLEFQFNSQNKEWIPKVIAEFKLLGQSQIGSLSMINGKVQYEAKQGSLTKPTVLQNIGSLTFTRFSASLGKEATVDANAIISTSGAMNSLIDKSFSANVSGNPGNLTIKALKKSEIPSISLGSNIQLEMWPISINEKNTSPEGSTVSASNNSNSSKHEFSWDVTSSLNLGTKSLSSNLVVEKDTIKIKDLSLVDQLPKLDLTLKKTTNSGNGSWDLILNQKLQSSDINPLLKGLGLPNIQGNNSIPINGFVSSEAIEISFQETPSLPAWLPDWVSGSVNAFTLTHQFSDNKSVIDFLLLDVPLDKIPGMPQGSKANFSCIAGQGVIAPSMTPTSSEGWYKKVWKDLGSSTGQKFNWLSNHGNGEEMGFAMGFADTSVQFNSTTLNGASFSHFAIGGSSTGWEVLGKTKYVTGLDQSIPINKLIPPTLLLFFSYDGSEFIAKDNFGKSYDAIPDFGISMDTLELSYGANKQWVFTAKSKLDLFGVDLPGKVILPKGGDPSFQPTFPSGGLNLSFGALSPVFKTLVLQLGEDYSANGTAVIKKSNNNFISSSLSNDLNLEFSLSKSNGWTFHSSQQSTPIILANIGKGSFEIDSLGISENSNKEKVIGGKGAFTFNGGSKMKATYVVASDSTHFIMDEFEPVAGVKMKAQASITGVGSSKTYSGSVSGDISNEDMRALLNNFNLQAKPSNQPITTSVGGSFSSNGDLDLYFINIPALNGVAVEPIMTLGAIDTLTFKQKAGTKSFHLASHLGIDHLAPLDENNKGGLKAILTLTKPATTGASNIIDIRLKEEISFNLDIGRMTFHSYDCHFEEKWTIDGKATLDQLPAYANSAMDLMNVKNSFGLDISYSNDAFNIVGDIYNKNGQKSPGLQFDVIPGTAVANLASVILAKDSAGIDFGMISSVSINNQQFPGKVSLNPSAQSVDFKPEASVSVGFTLDFKEAGALRVGGMVFSVGSKISVSADTVKVTAGNPKHFFWKDIVKSDHLMGDFSANNEGEIIVSMQLPNGGIKESMQLGSKKVNVGTANFTITEVTFSTNGVIGGKGEVDINQSDFDVQILPGPTFSITPKGANELAIPTIYVGKDATETEFNFNSSSRFLLATNAIGIETLTFDHIDFKANNVKDTSKKFFELRFDTLVFYMDGPGLMFFDLFDGYVNIAGLDGELKMSLPDPLSPQSTEAFKETLEKVVLGGDFAHNISNLNAPAFKLIEGHIKVPDFFGGGQIALAPADYEIKQLGPFFEVLDNEMQNDIKIGESFIQQAISEAINEATSPHQFKVFGATINSNLSYSYQHGLSYTFNFNGQTMANGHAKLTADFSSTLSKEDFSVKADGSIQLKTAGTWHSGSSCSFVLTQTELSFKGNIFTEGKLSGSLNSSGFSGKASFDDVYHLDGHVSLSPSGFSGSIGLQENHHYLVKLDVNSHGDLSVSGHTHINPSVNVTGCNVVDFYFDYDLSYNIPSGHASFSASIYPHGKGICGHSFSKFDVTFKDDHVWGDFKAGDSYHFHYSFHKSGSSNRYLKNTTWNKTFSL